MDFSFFSEIQLTEYLPWILPPLIGAVIGYVTNAIAIRMLFRPLTEIRVLGVRLPLTPGIIPKQRAQLAESIGQMVSRELLTEEAVRRQLATESFKIKLEQNIYSLLGDIISTPLAKLQGGNQELVFTSVEGFLSEGLYSFFSSRSFIHGVRNILGRVIRSVGEKRVGELLAETEVGTLVVERLIPLVSQPESRGKIASALENWFEQRRRGNERLASHLSEELAQVLTDLLATLLPSLFDSLFRWLDQEEIREQMNHRGKRLLRTVLEKLNVLQRFLISAGQFDRTLEQKVDRLLVRAGEEGTRKRLAAAIDRLLGKVKDRTLGEILTRYFRIPEQEAIDYVSNKVLAFLLRKETSQAIAAEVVSFSRKFMEEHRENNIAELLHIEPALQKRAGAYLSTQLIRIIDARLPGFIESFDVRQLVVDKINGLDVAQVEKLLLMVIQKHLRWINIFGGILGALIGFSQLVLRLLA
jgi:uncharacterized membrane protein YheB (UPF0754 family)